MLSTIQEKIDFIVAYTKSLENGIIPLRLIMVEDVMDILIEVDNKVQEIKENFNGTTAELADILNNYCTIVIFFHMAKYHEFNLDGYTDKLSSINHTCENMILARE